MERKLFYNVYWWYLLLLYFTFRGLNILVTFDFDVILHLQKGCGNNTRTSFVPFTHVHHCSRFSLFIFVCVCVCFEPFECKLETASPFTSEYFIVHFLRIRTVSYVTKCSYQNQEFNMDTIVLFNPQYLFKFCKLSK